MKKIILIATMIISTASFAQEEKKDNTEYEPKTIFSKKEGGSKTHIGGWGGVTPSYQMIDGKAGYSSFGRGCVLINHTLSLGFGGGFGFTASEQNKDLSETLTFYTAANYWGFIIGYDIKPAEPIHVSLSLLVGGGYISYHESSHEDDTLESDYYDNKLEQIDHDNYTFATRPSIGVDFNITKWFRAGLEAAYLYAPSKAISVQKFPGTDTTATPIQVVSKNGLSGFSAGVSFKFGAF